MPSREIWKTWIQKIIPFTLETFMVELLVVSIRRSFNLQPPWSFCICRSWLLSSFFLLLFFFQSNRWSSFRCWRTSSWQRWHCENMQPSLLGTTFTMKVRLTPVRLLLILSLPSRLFLCLQVGQWSCKYCIVGKVEKSQQKSSVRFLVLVLTLFSFFSLPLNPFSSFSK